MATRKTQRSLPPGDEPWQHFSVRINKTRGRAEIYATVEAGAVTGVVGTRQPMRRPEWQGVVAMRVADEPLTLEDAALCAMQALTNAFPTLF